MKNIYFTKNKKIIISFICFLCLIAFFVVNRKYVYIRNIKIVIVDEQTNNPIPNISANYGISRYEMGSNWEIAKRYYVQCSKKYTDNNGEVNFGGFFLKRNKYNSNMFSHLGLMGTGLNFLDYISNGIVSEKYFGNGIKEEMIFVNIELDGENSNDSKLLLESTTFFVDNNIDLYKKSNLNYSSLAIVNRYGNDDKLSSYPIHEKRFDILWVSDGLNFRNKKMVVKLKKEQE